LSEISKAEENSKGGDVEKVRIKDFTEQENRTWTKLYSGLERCREVQAHPLFPAGLEKLGITGDRIPDLEKVNARLNALTGWRGIPVKGLEEAPSFFEGLARREFPIGNFIRDAQDISYTPAPDIFHDLYGHLPFFADKDYAGFCEEFGRKAREAVNDPRRLQEFGSLFWFAVEFPLIETTLGRRIFGGGILSSVKESAYSLSGEPEVLPFDPEVICQTEYKIDELQKRVFLLKSPEELYGCLAKF